MISKDLYFSTKMRSKGASCGVVSATHWYHNPNLICMSSNSFARLFAALRKPLTLNRNVTSNLSPEPTLLIQPIRPLHSHICEPIRCNNELLARPPALRHARLTRVRQLMHIRIARCEERRKSSREAFVNERLGGLDSIDLVPLLLVSGLFLSLTI